MSRLLNGKNKLLLRIILAYAGIAILAPLIANEKPLYVSINGNSYFPAFSDDPYINLPDGGKFVKVRTSNIDWKNFNANIIVFPPVCWSPVKSDLLNISVSPMGDQQLRRGMTVAEMPSRFRHFLGTGRTGNDVLAELIHGTRTTLTIGFLAMTLAAFTGILLGVIAGFFGDFKVRMRKGSFIISLLMILPAWFYSFYLQRENLSAAFIHNFISGTLLLSFITILFLALLLWPALLKFPFAWFNKKIYLPVDSVISRIIEIFLSIPRLILILTLAAISSPSLVSLVLIIGLTSWTEFARVMRSRILQLKELNFVDVSRAMGTKTYQIILRHIIPNALTQIVVLWTFNVAAAVLIETGLSFLGVGVPAGTPTWGALMNEGRQNFQDWWLVVFPGLTIFTLLSSLYLIGNKLNPGIIKSTGVS